MKLPAFPRAVDDPRQMPKLRDALGEFMVDHHWVEMEAIRHLQNIVGPNGSVEFGSDGNVIISGPNHIDVSRAPEIMAMAEMAGRNTIDWYVKQLPRTQLIYVTDDLTELVKQAAQAVPDDYVLHEELMPALAGFVVFATPLWGVDAINENSVRVDAFMWAPAMLPPKEQGWWYQADDAFTTPAISIAAFRLMEPAMALDPYDTGAVGWYAEGRSDPFNNQPFWMPLGRSDWLTGQQLGDPSHIGIDTETTAWQSMKEDRQLMASLWSILQQRRLIDSREVTVHAPKPKYQKHVKLPPPERVQIVHLRKTQTGPVQTGTGRTIGVRYVVKPHWRRQAYGPGWSKHRLVLINSHIRGPEGAPLSKGENVWSLDK